MKTQRNPQFRIGLRVLDLLSFLVILPLGHQAIAQNRICFSTNKSIDSSLGMKIEVKPGGRLRSAECKERSPQKKRLTTQQPPKRLSLQGMSWDLTADACEITTLNLNNPLLKTLDISYNHLTTLDVLHAVGLETLACYGNNIKELDLEASSKLSYIDCGGDKMQKLSIGSSNSVVRYISCHTNEFSDAALQALSKQLLDLSIQQDTPSKRIVLLNQDQIGNEDQNTVTNRLLTRLLKKGWQPFQRVDSEPSPFNPIDKNSFITLTTTPPLVAQSGWKSLPTENLIFSWKTCPVWILTRLRRAGPNTLSPHKSLRSLER